MTASLGVVGRPGTGLPWWRDGYWATAAWGAAVKGLSVERDEGCACG